VVHLFVEIPNSLDRETFDESDWWEDQLMCKDYQSIISSFLEEGVSWSKSLRLWGDLEKDCVSILMDNHRIVEVEIRIDVRRVNTSYVENICHFAKLCDCMLLTEDLNLIEPDGELLLRQIVHSKASKFVSDPVSFLHGLGDS
jgi:hypothetical protein